MLKKPQLYLILRFRPIHRRGEWLRILQVVQVVRAPTIMLDFVPQLRDANAMQPGWCILVRLVVAESTPFSNALAL